MSVQTFGSVKQRVKEGSVDAPIAVYVHIPFCPSKCGYCDFNSYGMGADGKAGLEEDLVPRTVDAIIKEIEASPLRGTPSKTIFFGGGTPTYLSGGQLKRILDAARLVHPPISDCEITSEANPGTIDATKFAEMKAAGFNRLSIGGQSFDDNELKQLGRVHKAGEIERAIRTAKEAGFDNINLDLMFALPNQPTSIWRSNLRRAIELQPNHLSLYCLTVEPRTAFQKLWDAGKLPLPNEDIQSEMFELAAEMAQAAGYNQYEISNFAQPGKRCRHNLAYWHAEVYAGYGPGAVQCTYINHSKSPHSLVREMNLRHPRRYCEALEKNEPIKCETEELTTSNIRTEKIMLGLRLNQGLIVQNLMISSKTLEDLSHRGWITWERDEERIKLTREGRLVCSEVTLRLID